MSAERQPDHPLERLVFFSDAVFAIVITLLVLEIHVPHLAVQASERAWLQALVDLLPHFFAFLLSFLVIGGLWASHHALFMMVDRYDPRMIWPNLLLLLSVTFLPFTTSLLATGSFATTPFAFYAASLIAAGLMKARLVRVVLAPTLTRSDIDPAAVGAELRRRWALPIAAGVTLLLAFVTTPWNSAGMLLLPLLKRVLPGRKVAGEEPPPGA